jgi:PDZ domain-containing protein
VLAAVRSDREVLRESEVLPADITPSEYDAWQHALFLDSQQLAAAAAAQANGLPATVTGAGAAVVGTAADSPAAAVLEEGDTIVAVDGQPVNLANDVHDLVSPHPTGTRFALTVERDGRRLVVDVRSAELPEVSGGIGLGVIAATRDLRVDLPFRITFRSRPDIGGPSAGMAYALAIADMLDPTDDARGRTIAATGTIGADGTVGEVGGIAEKAASARDAGADLFVVPAGEEGDAEHSGVTTVPVETLAQALSALRTGSLSAVRTG